MATWMMTAVRVTRRQTKPSQIDAPKIAGTEMMYWNSSSRLSTVIATPMAPASVTAITRRPTSR